MRHFRWGRTRGASQYLPAKLGSESLSPASTMQNSENICCTHKIACKIERRPFVVVPSHCLCKEQQFSKKCNLLNDLEAVICDPLLIPLLRTASG